MIIYRWLEDAELDQVNAACERQGYAQLNINPEMPTCRVMGAFLDGLLVEALAFQLYPVVGPLVRVEPEFRDDGTTSRTLVQKMHDYLEEAQARGYIAIAESLYGQRMCERHDMRRITVPVFEFVKR